MNDRAEGVRDLQEEAFIGGDVAVRGACPRLSAAMGKP